MVREGTGDDVLHQLAWHTCEWHWSVVGWVILFSLFEDHLRILPVRWDYFGVDGGQECSCQDCSHFGCQLSEDSWANGIRATCFVGLQTMEKFPHLLYWNLDATKDWEVMWWVHVALRLQILHGYSSCPHWTLAGIACWGCQPVLLDLIPIFLLPSRKQCHSWRTSDASRRSRSICSL